MTTLITAPPSRFGRQDWRMVWVVVRREVQDTIRDWRLVGPIVLLTLFFPWLMLVVSRWVVAYAAAYNTDIVGEQVIPLLLLVVGFFPTSFSLVIALEAFVGEQERKSLEPLLSTPLSDRQLYLGKMLAAVIPPVLGSYIGMFLFTAGALLLFGRVEWQAWLLVILLTTLQAALMVAASVVVSSQTTSVRAANMLASFILVPISLLLQVEAYWLFWEYHTELWLLLAAVAVTTFIFIRMGIQLFSRERLLGRNIDFLRLAWIGQFVWGRFSGRGADGRYPSIRGWYAQVWGLLPHLRLPSAVLMASLTAAALGGVWLTDSYPMPVELLQRLRTAETQEKLVVMQETMRGLPLFIFSHNVRALGLTAVLGTLTFGVASVAIFMLPWGVISFGTAQLATVGESPLLFLAATVLPHAVVELPALLLVVSAALRWQAIIISPPTYRTVGEEWLEAGADFMRIYLGLGLPLLFLAAFLEAFVTPAVMVWVYGG